jgi:hypothetical protein
VRIGTENAESAVLTASVPVVSSGQLAEREHPLAAAGRR